MRTRTLLYLFFITITLVPIRYAGAQTSTWFTPLNFGLVPRPVEGTRYDDIYFISHDTGSLVSSYGMIFKTYDGAQHWTLKKAIAADVYFRSLEFSADGQVGIAGSVSGFIYRSADRGETWDDISGSIQDTGASAKNICGLGHWGNIFYGVGWWGGLQARFYKSTDAGITWTTSYIDTSLASGLVDISFQSANKGFVTGYRAYDHNTKRESVVLRTLDGGNTWTKVFSDTVIGGRIWKIQFIDSMYAVGSIEPMYKDTVAIIKSIDGGDSWHIIPIGHTNAYSWIDAGTQGVGFINRQKGWVGGYYNGMFETNDGGLTWDSLAVNEECDRFFLIDSTMYCSANTVYKYGNAQSTKVTTQQPPSFVHKLYPVVPNPSSGNVQIDFDINSHQTNTVLEVVNTDGRKTYPIMKGYLKPGHYSYKWDGTNSPAGNYIVWLGTDEIPMVQKFVLIR
jgi:photosystem II stability/assembly factor-like uncharacterized protein